MQLLTNVAQQTRAIVAAQPLTRRLLLLVVILASMGAMTLLVMRAHTGGYVILYDNLERGSAGEIATVLNQRGIQYKAENAGAMIKVPRSKLEEAILALSMEGIPDSGTVGFELLDKGMLGQSNFVQQKNYHRMLEGEISRTLMKVEEIEQARVHIALPEDSLFVTEQKHATASVQVKLRRGRQLTERQVSGISHLISRAVEGLETDAVSIVDQQGNLLSQSRDNEILQASGVNQTYKTRYEERLKKEVETLIESTLGPGRVAARVQADFDFSTMDEQREIFNPDAQDAIPQMEQQTTEQSAAPASAVTAAAGGAAGSTSNVPDLATSGAGGAPAAPAQGTLRQEVTRQFAVSRQSLKTTQTAPKLTRLTVAVLVDGEYDEPAAGAPEGAEPEFRPRPEEELATLRTLVEATIGFDGERGDIVTVQSAPFSMTEFETMEEGGWLSRPETRRLVELGIQWGTVALIGLLLILGVIRPALKQVLVSPVHDHPQALPAGLAGRMAMIDANAGSGAAAAAAGGGAAAGKPKANAPKGPSMANMLLGGDQARQFEMQQMAEHARISQEQAQNIHREVVDTAKSQPQKSVSLLRQWMDEA